MANNIAASQPIPAREARLNRSAHETLSPGEIAIGVIIGRTSEFFDFFVYAIASVLVFPKMLFPWATPLTGTLFSFALFSVAFIARPFGTVLFSMIDRAHGKGAKLTAALFLLGASTAAIAFLPGYDVVGNFAAVLLVLARIGQGLALGGVWDGLATLLAMSAPKSKHGWYAMIPQIGAPLGLIVASGLFAYFAANLSTADFLEWGWRYPFFVAFAINVVALFARLRIVVTPEYLQQFESRELTPAPILETLRAEGGTIFAGAFVPLASFALFHMVTVFPLSWVFLFTPQTPARFLTIEMIGAVFGLAAIIVSGMLADRFGRRSLLKATAVGIAVFSGFAPQLLDGGDAGQLAFMVVGFILLGVSFGQASGVMANSFSKPHRYTGSALTSDLAWLFGAGFAPIAALLLASHFGLAWSGAYLLSGAVATLVALALKPSADGAAM